MTDINGKQIDLGPEEGWIDLKRELWPGMGRNFVAGDPDSNRLRVRYFRNGPDGPIVGKVWFGPGAEGPPGHAHGGSLSALLDEVMGTSCWIAGHSVMTASMTIDYRNRVPLGVIATFEGWVDKVKGRKVFPRSKLVGTDGTLYAEGSGLFIAIGGKKFAEMAQEAGKPEFERIRQAVGREA